MRTISIIVLLAVAGVACSKEEPAAPEPAPEPKAAEPAPPQEVAFDAKATFQTVCSTCHGAAGGGDGPAGAALDPKPAAFASAEFWADGKDKDHVMKVIKLGGAAVGKSPLMAAYGSQYNDEQIGELADVVLSFKPEGAGAAAEGEAPAAE